MTWPIFHRQVLEVHMRVAHESHSSTWSCHELITLHCFSVPRLSLHLTIPHASCGIMLKTMRSFGTDSQSSELLDGIRLGLNKYWYKKGEQLLPSHFFFLAAHGFELRASCLLSRHSYSLSHSISLILWWVFWDRVLQTICPGWFRTTIFLIFASWVARITGMNHQCLAYFLN
jgi:hypothetical protein